MATTVGLTILATLCALVAAVPDVAFPFNSQVPTVARVNEPYHFQFSASTFVPGATNFTYSLSNQPAWLLLDGATRTLLGTPTPQDVGAAQFTLTAADETGVAHMPCTIVASSDPAPRLEGDISAQLASSLNLSSTTPPSVTLLPSSTFAFHFERSSFIDALPRTLYYYATLTDRTPLPAWLIFDGQALSFSGTAPTLSAFPQSWDVQLIASDVPGFAAATAQFTVAINTQQLVFVPAEQTVNIKRGQELDFAGLADDLFRNGEHLETTQIAHVGAGSAPAWLKVDPSTLTLTGSVPADAMTESFSISVTDSLGNTASTIITLEASNKSSEGSLLTGDIGPLVAYQGRPFSYSIPRSLLLDENVSLSVQMPSGAPWLNFDEATRTLHGDVPDNATPTTLTATLDARAPESDDIQSEIFTLDVRQVTSPALATPTATPSGVPMLQAGDKQLSNGQIAAIVICSVLGATIIAGFLFFCCWRRRRASSINQQHADKSSISRPIPSPTGHGIIVSTELHRDVEKAVSETPPRQSESPPHVAWEPPSKTDNRASRWLKRFSHQSRASSMGPGEAAIRADANIPEWPNAALQPPHHSFLLPMGMGRHSKQGVDARKSKQSNRDDARWRLSSGPSLSPVPPPTTSQSDFLQSRAASNPVTMPSTDTCSQLTTSTPRTSLLTKPSDSQRLPTRSGTFPMSTIPAWTSIGDGDKRNTIRVVGSSDSVFDQRTILEKRESYIKNRKSHSSKGLLFAGGPMAPSRKGSKSGFSIAASSSIGGASRSRRSQTQLTTPSEEPETPTRPSRRHLRRFSTKLRSTFGPNYPKVVAGSDVKRRDDEGDDDDWNTSASSMSDEKSKAEERKLNIQYALPRHERDWVLPGETPTPPPSSHQLSSRFSLGRQGRFRSRDRSSEGPSSPLAMEVIDPIGESLQAQLRASGGGNRLSEPLSLVSKDSVSRAKTERPPRVRDTRSRPVSIDDVHDRLSSMRAHTVVDADAQAGSENWEDCVTEMPVPVPGSKASTMRSNVSGPAFL